MSGTPPESSTTRDGTRREDNDVRARIERFLEETGARAHGATFAPLAGDASDRRYFRVLLADGPSQVLAVQPGPIEFERLPFVNVARLLSMLSLPIPNILGHSDPLGIIALQDLGDVTLQAHLASAPTDERLALYRQAITLIETMQRRAEDVKSRDYLPYSLAFDVEKLTWELQFFTTHFLEAYRGAALTATSRQALAAEYAAIAEDLSGERRVLCHRDYHSRNLMLHEGTLFLIDFQDARMGPDTYDLVSLLRDSYVDFNEDEVSDLIAFYLTRRARDGGIPADAQAFRPRFDLMALQRNLKALGTFGFQTRSRGNPAFVQYVPRTLNHAKATLARYPRFRRLRELLGEHLQELLP